MFRLALVTGASSGIGEAVCRLLAAKGVDLVISGRDIDKLDRLVQELGAAVNVKVVPADLTVDEDRRCLVEEIHRAVPDLVINNAGLGLYGDALDHRTQDQMALMEVNASAVLELSLEAARALKENDSEGTIVNVSSAAAFQPFPGFAVYAATKAFVNAFSLAFHEELRDDGIDVLVACPGQVDTAFRQRAALGADRGQPPSYIMSASYAAEQIWWQIEKKRELHTFSWRYRLGAFLASHILPRRWLSKVLHRHILRRV